MTFNQEKVAKVAIDKKKHQQIFVSSSKYNYKLIQILKEMGFEIDYEALYDVPEHYMFTINTIDKEVYRSRGNVLAQVLPSGGKLLDIVDCLMLIDF